MPDERIYFLKEMGEVHESLGEFRQTLLAVHTRLDEQKDAMNAHYADEKIQASKIEELSQKVSNGHADEHVFLKMLIAKQEARNKLYQKVIDSFAVSTPKALLAVVLLGIAYFFPSVSKAITALLK